MFRRFFSPFMLSVFSAIASADIDDKSKRWHRRRAVNRLGGYSYKPNGAQVCARRRAQIACGQLTAANGLQIEVH